MLLQVLCSGGTRPEKTQRVGSQTAALVWQKGVAMVWVVPEPNPRQLI